ncbi:MAG: trigger factor [Anaerolineae bacterium]|nr:trigger factor [Anaerolineae bacterium]MDW8072253.1 trigger factor [Anaerolineae bacterium]
MLKVTTQPLERCQVLMTVEVDDAQAEQLLKAAAKRISTQVQIPGFRPGKAPYAVIVRRFGEEIIREEALEDLTSKVFQEALKQANLEPFAPATLEEVTWQPLVMKVRVPLEPQVELDDYRALRLEPVSVEVDEAEIEEALAKMQRQYASWQTVERPACVGDRVEVSVQIEIDGNPSSHEKLVLPVRDPDADAKYAALLKPLIGMAAGEERSVTVPAALFWGDEAANEDEEEQLVDGTSELVKAVLDALEKGEEAADRQVTLRFKAHAVQEGHLHPLDDSFAQMVGDFNTLQELRARVQESLIKEKRAEIERAQTVQMIERIIETARVEWPSVLEESALDRWVSGLEQSLREKGMPLQTYLRTQQKSLEQLREEMRPQVQSQLRRSLVLQEIARREGLSVEKGEVLRFIETMATIAARRGEPVPSTIAPETVRQVYKDLLDIKVYTRLGEILRGAGQEPPAGHAGETQEAAGSAGETSAMSAEAGARGETSAVVSASETP